MFFYSCNYGWGALLASIPKGLADFNYGYASKYKISLACKICGYIVLYNNSCECCEERVWDEKEFNYYDDEEGYIKSHQLNWYEDDDDTLQEHTDVYPK